MARLNSPSWWLTFKMGISLCALPGLFAFTFYQMENDPDFMERNAKFLFPTAAALFVLLAAVTTGEYVRKGSAARTNVDHVEQPVFWVAGIAAAVAIGMSLSKTGPDKLAPYTFSAVIGVEGIALNLAKAKAAWDQMYRAEVYTRAAVTAVAILNLGAIAAAPTMLNYEWLSPSFMLYAAAAGNAAIASLVGVSHLGSMLWDKCRASYTRHEERQPLLDHDAAERGQIQGRRDELVPSLAAPY